MIEWVKIRHKKIYQISIFSAQIVFHPREKQTKVDQDDEKIVDFLFLYEEGFLNDKLISLIVPNRYD